MKSIWKDVAEKLKIDEGLLKQRNYSVLGESVVIIEGQKNVLSVGENEISFQYGEGALSVVGEKLKIKMVSKGFAVVEGKIHKVERR